MAIKTGGGFLNEGTLDQERLMKPLLDGGFDGWIIIECGKKDTTPAEYAANSAAYSRFVLSKPEIVLKAPLSVSLLP